MNIHIPQKYNTNWLQNNKNKSTANGEGGDNPTNPPWLYVLMYINIY